MVQRLYRANEQEAAQGGCKATTAANWTVSVKVKGQRVKTEVEMRPYLHENDLHAHRGSATPCFVLLFSLSVLLMMLIKKQ